MLELQGGMIGHTNDDFPSLPGKRVEVNANASYGLRFGRSFANVLRATEGGVKFLSSCRLDVFPVPGCYEAELGKVEPRSAVDCYAMEDAQVLSKEILVAPSLATPFLATADLLKMKEWMMHRIGHFCKEVGQAFDGLFARLELKSKGVQNRVGSVHGPGHGLVIRSACGLDHGSDPNLDLDLGSEFGFFIAFGSDQSDPLPAASSPGLSMQDTSLGSGVHGELGFATAERGDTASDFQPVSPIYASNLPSDSITSALLSSADSFEIEVIPVPLP